ncbi:MAG: aminopeptidase P family protein [Pseudomonadota bacterium]
MFQSFDVLSDPSTVAPRLAALRAHMAKLGLDLLLVPRADAYQNEYLPPDQERLAWLTGFTGSAGYAIISQASAILFVDGRYTLQAAAQTDTSRFEVVHLIDVGPLKHLQTMLQAGQTIGFDPWLHTRAGITKLRDLAKRKGADLAALDSNPVDALWDDRPPPPLAPIAVHPVALAGTAPDAKLEEIRAELSERQADALVITQPDNLAWLFNVRGGDVGHTPLPLGFAVIARESRPTVFFAPEKLDETVRTHLSAHADIAEPGAFLTALTDLGRAGTAVSLSFSATAEQIVRTLEEAGAKLIDKPDPCTLAKAKKTDAEIAGTRTAHIRDGAAIARFLAWFEAEAPKGGLDEIAAATKLEACRRETNQLKDISFDTISGAGPNGAIVHYRVTTDTNRRISSGELYLVDSGGQYTDGTTDITRTLSVSTVTDDQRRAFTLVLKGMIAISTARFPKGTTGAQLDALARINLWTSGFDYDHGTGHGVGSYLGVHEGPQRISKTGHVALESGMILSNEPGYYREGAFGIRIENLVLVTQATQIPGGDIDMLGFETLTFAPIDRALIDPDLLSNDERSWLNDYHTAVYAKLSPDLDEMTRVWLERACAEI